MRSAEFILIIFAIANAIFSLIQPMRITGFLGWLVVIISTIQLAGERRKEADDK